MNTKEEVQWFAGKRMAYIYKLRWRKWFSLSGKVIRPHGNSGGVHAKFTSNIPPKSGVREIHETHTQDTFISFHLHVYIPLYFYVVLKARSLQFGDLQKKLQSVCV